MFPLLPEVKEDKEKEWQEIVKMDASKGLRDIDDVNTLSMLSAKITRKY